MLSDVLITDYSSVMVEYSILNKPIVLFAYDLDDYLSNERGFYFDYRENVPGRIAYDMDELIRVFKEKDFDLERLNDFGLFRWKLQQAHTGHSFRRLILSYFFLSFFIFLVFF